MKVDLPLAVKHDALDGVAELARAAEEAGFDGVTYSELTSDPLLHLTIAAGATSQVDLLTNIIVAFARSPMTLAVQGRAIQEYSKGRLILGLGSQIKPHIERRFSMPWSHPAARMTEFIAAMRAIWSAWETGDKLDFQGDFYTHTLMTPMFTPTSDYPAPKVLVAAVGEHMTAAAAAVADGLLVHGFSTERYLREVTIPGIEMGRREAGRDLSEHFEIVSSAFVVTGRTEQQLAAARVRVKEQIAFYASTPAYRPVLALHGWGELGDQLHDLSRTSESDRWQRMGTLIDDEVLEAFAVIGEPSEIGPQLVRRFGDVITRYEANTVRADDPQLSLEVATSIKDAFQGIA